MHTPHTHKRHTTHKHAYFPNLHIFVAWRMCDEVCAGAGSMQAFPEIKQTSERFHAAKDAANIALRLRVRACVFVCLFVCLFVCVVCAVCVGGWVGVLIVQWTARHTCYRHASTLLPICDVLCYQYASRLSKLALLWVPKLLRTVRH